MSIRKDLEQRAKKAILKGIFENYKKQRSDWLKEPGIRKAVFLASLFRTSNALIIGGVILLTGCLTLLVFPLLGLTGVGWLAAGGIGGLLALILGEALFFYQSLKDENLHAEAVSEMFEPQINFNPDTISDEVLNEKIDKALEYWSLIDDTIRKAPNGVLRDRLARTAQEVTHWLQAVYNLADRVDKFQQNKVVERDLKSIPQVIADYEKKLRKEDSPEVQRQLERTISDKKRQLHALQNLESSMERAAYQLESTISSLGTIYSQLLLVGNKDEEGSRLNRLQEEVSEQVHQLEDLAEAMDEVYQSSY
jgi:hypothetical protein